MKPREPPAVITDLEAGGGLGTHLGPAWHGRRRQSERWAGPAPPAFTLIELLVVISIIATLMALMLPALGRARDVAKKLTCQVNIRTLGQAMAVYAVDNLQQLPSADPWGWASYPDGTPCNIPDWLNGMTRSETDQPQSGSLFGYEGEVARAYLCPGKVPGGPHSGSGSNGLFDYAFWCAFNGARMDSIILPAKVESPTEPGTYITDQVFTPMISDEEAAFYLNAPNHPWEGCYSQTDQMGHMHLGSANYLTVDISVHSYAEPEGVDAGFWFARAPSGTWVSLGQYDSDGYGPGGLPGTYAGWWNRQ